MGFNPQIIMLEDVQANGFAEVFVKVLVKLIHTEMVEGTDLRHMVNRYLMAYRAAPHRMMGKSPAELMFGQRIPTKLPRLLIKAQGKSTRRQGRLMRSREPSRRHMQMLSGVLRKR